MKINSIHIFGFGKFKDFKLDFNDTFNLIYGKNENGKTTIAEFIKMMFYGSKPRITDVFKNPRTKYKPLDGGAMAGSITFEHSGYIYRLEREFRSSNATDKITLYNLDLGTSETLSGNSDIGSRFFGVGFGAFEKSVFISNSVAFEKDSDADDDINSKLSNISNTGDENVSFEAVSSRITAAMEEIKTKTGRGGNLVKLENAIIRLDEEMSADKEKLAERDALELKIDELTIKLDSLSRDKKECFERLKSAEKLEIKTKLQEFVRVAEEFEALEKTITLSDGVVADKIFCDKLDELLSSTEKSVELCDMLSAEVNRLTAEVCTLDENDNTDTGETLEAQLCECENQISRLQKENDDLKIEIIQCGEKLKNSKSKTNVPLLVIGLLLICLAVFGGIFIEKFLFTFSGIGVILFSMAFILKGKPDNSALNLKMQTLMGTGENINREIEKNTKKQTELREKMQKIAVEKATNKSLLGEKKERLIEKRTALLEAQNTSAAALSQLLAFSSQLSITPDITSAKENLALINRNLQEMGRLKVAAEYAAKGTGCKNLKEAKERLSFINLSDDGAIGSLDTLKEELNKITEDYNAVSRELAVLKAEARSAFIGLKVPAEYEREKNELLTQKAEQLDYYETLSVAHEALSEAFAEVRRSFSGVLENRALKLLSQVTNEKYNGISVSKNFDISVSDKKNFGTHGLQYLSKGAMHQAYFSLRLALAELIGQESGSLPIILDDAFSQYDDERLKTAMEFLKKYSENSQIIFFTCHNDCREAAENASAKIINL